jgi:hypothetical protein
MSRRGDRSMDITSRTIKRRGNHSRSASAVKPAISGFRDIDIELLNQSLTKLFPTWIRETFAIFGPTGTAVSSCQFWESQIQLELDHRLWQKDFLGREPTEEERDCLTESVMEIHWPIIEDTLRRRRLILPFLELAAEMEPGLQVHQKKTKLRRSFTLEEMMERMNINDGHEHGVSDEESNVVESDLEVWDDVLDTISLKRELKKVEQDEKVRWMRSGKPMRGLQDELAMDNAPNAVNT